MKEVSFLTLKMQGLMLSLMTNVLAWRACFSADDRDAGLSLVDFNG